LIKSRFYSDIKQACRKDTQINSLLKEKHGYSGGGVQSLTYAEAKSDVYLNALKKFKKAIGLTLFFRSLENVDLIYFDDTKRFKVYEDDEFTFIDYYLPVETSVFSYVGFLSENSDAEPIYQNYLKVTKAKVEKSLKKNFKNYYSFNELGRKIICDASIELQYNEEEIKKIVEEFQSTKKVKNIEYFRPISLEGGLDSESLDIWFEGENPSRLSLFKSIGRDGEVLSYSVQIDNKVNEFLLEDSELTKAKYDNDCLFQSGKIWKYGTNLKLWKREWFNFEGSMVRETYINRVILPLDEIYPENSDFLLIANRKNRVLITILDSGIDYNHPKLAYKIPRYIMSAEELKKLEKKNQQLFDRMIQSIVGWDFETEDSMPYDYSDYFFNIYESFDHGTHVGGIVTKGSDELALLPIRYSSTEGEKLYTAIEMAHFRGSKIVNISLGSTDKDYWLPLSKAMSDHPDMLFIVAAGNEEANLNEDPIYPACFNHSNMLVVGSVDRNNEWSTFSNYSPTHVDIAAYGEDILSSEPENALGLKSGTSMATPLVTRSAGKILYNNPDASPEEIIKIIRKSSIPIASLKDKVRFGSVLSPID
jgi:hypothetical protein